MTRNTSERCCHRALSEKDTVIADTDFDTTEHAVLGTARYFWQTFATPEAQAWLFAFQFAEQNLTSEVGLDVLAAVQAMRMSRSSAFRFNNPMCEGCSTILSEHERQFMNVFRAVRENRRGAAKTHAMILCEGNATDTFIERMAE
ncbi:MAG: hypothetical protein AAGI36_11200, partial [Pseudomonadota bacterium]